MITDESQEKGVQEIEAGPACEHRYTVEHADGSVYCWICGVTLLFVE